MVKRFLSLVLVGLLANVLMATTPALAKTQGAQGMQSSEQVRSKIARLGVGEKARATVWLKNGTKVKGYIAQAGENDAVIRDRKTDAPTTVAYQDITKVDNNRGHSTARNIAIGVGVGAAAVITVLAILIATSFD